MSYDLVRLALLTLPPVPEDPYDEPAHRNDAIAAHPLGAGLAREAMNYVLAVQRWLMAVRWRASLRAYDPDVSASSIPGEEWKRILRPWLASLTTEAHSEHGRAAGFDGWNLLTAFMNHVGKAEDPTGLGGYTLEQVRELESLHASHRGPRGN